MAKIEVLKGTQTTVGPVGIVQMGGSAVAAGKSMAEAGQRIFDAAFSYAYDAEKQKGQNEASLAAISARDEKTGKLIFPEIPKSLSPVAQKYYEPIANKRYTDALLLDIDNEAQRTAKLHERDPEGFAKEFGLFLDTTKAQAGKFAGFVESSGLVASKQYQTKLFMDHVEFEDKLAAQKGIVAINKKMSDINSSAAAGATGTARAILNAGLEELKLFIGEHGDRVGMAYLPETDKKFRSSFVSGDIVNISNKLASSIGDTDPYQKSKLSSALNYMAIALENRSLDQIPPAVRVELEKAGLTKEYINDDVFAGLHQQIAREVRTRQGTVSEQFNAEKENMLTSAAMTSLAGGNNLSSKDSDRVFNITGIRTATDLGNNLKIVMTPPEDPAQRTQWEAQFGAVHEILFNTTGEFPTVIKDYLQNVDTLTADQLPVAIAMYQQATRFNRGTFIEQRHRGLNDETVMMYETLINVQDVLGTDALPEFMNNFILKDKASGDEVKANILRKLGEKKGTVSEAVRKFVGNIMPDASPDELTFYTRFADDLLYSMDKERVKTILKSAGDTVFRTSDMLHPSIGRSRFTPERAYTDDATMADFRFSVEGKLNLFGNRYKLGQNAFLVPDPREGSALPVYTLVDDNKNIITHNGKPLQVGNGYVLERMAERRRISIIELRQEAARHRELFIKNQDIFEEPYA